MSDRHFHLRLSCIYEGSENSVAALTVETIVDNKWEELELSVKSPGFLLFVSGLFSCQHLYMRTNSAERNLVLESAAGELKVRTDENWIIQESVVNFSAKLRSGSPTREDTAYIRERMHHCPVSSNLPAGLEVKNTVHFE